MFCRGQIRNEVVMVELTVYTARIKDSVEYGLQ